MDEAQLAALATVAANQATTTTALWKLTDEIKESREGMSEHVLEITRAIAVLSTDQATASTKLDAHLVHDDERIANVWRVLKWGSGLMLGGGTIAGGAKIASGLVL